MNKMVVMVHTNFDSVAVLQLNILSLSSIRAVITMAWQASYGPESIQNFLPMDTIMDMVALACPHIVLSHTMLCLLQPRTTLYN